MSDEPKPFLEHLEDFRTMLLKSVAVLAVNMMICLLFVRKILTLLQHPLAVAVGRHGGSVDKFLVSYNVMDTLTIIIQTGLMAGVVLALPFIFYFIGQFIFPALRPQERRMLLPAFTVGGGLFLCGVVFCYFMILPNTLDYMIELGQWIHVEARWTLLSYLSFVVQMMAAFGVAFELPLLISILSLLGLVTKSQLLGYWRHATVGIMIFAACMTPGDVFSMFMLAGPMLVLYFLSIGCAAWIERNRPVAPQPDETAYP